MVDHPAGLGTEPSERSRGHDLEHWLEAESLMQAAGEVGLEPVIVMLVTHF